MAAGALWAGSIVAGVATTVAMREPVSSIAMSCPARALARTSCSSRSVSWASRIANKCEVINHNLPAKSAFVEVAHNMSKIIAMQISKPIVMCGIQWSG